MHVMRLGGSASYPGSLTLSGIEKPAPLDAAPASSQGQPLACPSARKCQAMPLR